MVCPHIPGIGMISMISTASPGKIVKCGWVKEEARRGLVRVRLDDDEASEIVADVGYAVAADALGLAERAAFDGDDASMIALPALPGFHAGLYALAPALLVERIPSRGLGRRPVSGVDGHELLHPRCSCSLTA
jgi:hypothetical protein